jgi:hypothetical protein
LSKTHSGEFCGGSPTQPFRPRPKILRFLLGLRRSSSCGRDCADGLLEAVCMATAFISRDPGLTGPPKSVGGAGATTPQPFRPRPKILRFLLGLRRSSSCGRDCADGLLEAVCMATAFISCDPGLTGPQKSVGGAQESQELRHRSHFGQGQRLCGFC